MHYLLVATSKSLSMVDLSPSTVNPRTCVRPPGSLEPCANAVAPSSVRQKTPCSRDFCVPFGELEKLVGFAHQLAQTSPSEVAANL